MYGDWWDDIWGAAKDEASDAAGDVIGAAVGAGVDAISGAIGGDGSSGGYSMEPADYRGRRWCQNRPTDPQIDAVRRLATAAELAPVIQHWINAGKVQEFGPFFEVHPGEIGYWLMGHRDCQHSDPNGQRVQDHFLQLKQKYAPLPDGSGYGASNGAGGSSPATGGGGGGGGGVDLSTTYAVPGSVLPLLALGAVLFFAARR